MKFLDILVWEIALFLWLLKKDDEFRYAVLNLTMQIPLKQRLLNFFFATIGISKSSDNAEWRSMHLVLLIDNLNYCEKLYSKNLIGVEPNLILNFKL